MGSKSAIRGRSWTCEKCDDSGIAFDGCALGECCAVSSTTPLTHLATEVWQRIGSDIVLVRDAAGWRVHELRCPLESRPVGNHAATVEGAIASAHALIPSVPDAY